MIFKPYDQDQLYLLPPSLREWLPRNHLADFISDVVGEVSLDAIMKTYSRDGRSQPPYHPA